MNVISHRLYLGEPKRPGSDNHAHRVEEDDTTYRFCEFDANGASEALKSSKRWRVYFDQCLLRRGVEDCADHVRGGHIGYHACRFAGKGRKITAKGGLRNLSIVASRGLDLVVLGDYTKYDARAIWPDGTERKASPWRFARPPVRDVFIQGDERPLVICLHSERPTGNARVVKIPEFAVRIYFWLRATFWKEAQPVPEHEYHLQPEEI